MVLISIVVFVCTIFHDKLKKRLNVTSYNTQKNKKTL